MSLSHKVCVDIEYQGGQQKQGEMMTLYVPSEIHHLYGNENQDTALVLKTDVEVNKNRVATTRSRGLLEIS
jgi:hypothetical protein